MRSLNSQSQKNRSAIAELEDQLRAELTDLAAMAQTTAEFGHHQLAAIEVWMLGDGGNDPSFGDHLSNFRR